VIVFLFLCVATYGAIAMSANGDADKDGVADTIDIDDDNDSIPDIYEIAELGVDRDSDGDGVPDRLDLDSDGDGILDLNESGFYRSAAATQIRVESGRLRTQFGENGYADLLETQIDSGEIIFNLLNSDEQTGDILFDFQDLDSDNDGLLDLLEAGLPQTLDADRDGRIDPSFGGVGNDGIHDKFQIEVDVNCCDYNLDGTEDLTPRNTDGSDFPDFQDHDSDNDGIFDLREAGGQDIDNDSYVDGFLDDPGNPDGVDDALLLIPLEPGDENEDGTPNHLDAQTQYTGENVNENPQNEPETETATETTQEVEQTPDPAKPESQPEAGEPEGQDDATSEGVVDADTIQPDKPSGAIADDGTASGSTGSIETGLGCSLQPRTSGFDPALPGLLLLALFGLVRRATRSR